MVDRTVIVVPIDRATNVQRVADVATTLALPRAADIHFVDVSPEDGAWRAPEDWRGQIQHFADQTSRSTPVSLQVPRAGRARIVRLRGRAERIVPAYAQWSGAIATIMERDYVTSRLWRNAAMATELSRWSPVPVLVLPPSGPARERLTKGEIRHIVAAYDFTVGSAVALTRAIVFGHVHKAQVTMLHALKNYPGRSIYSGNEAWGIAQRLPGHRRRIAERLRRQARRFGYANADARVVTGDPARAIVTAASEADADMIVMGVAPRGWLDQLLFGSTLKGVLRRADTPVLVIPVTGAAERWSEDTMDEAVLGGLPTDSATARTAA